MHKPSLTPLLSALLFRPSTGAAASASDFAAFVAEYLVPEVRHETLRYYGHLASTESQYPGLDYASAHHRRRLEAYAAHRRLFRAFDALRCTPAEIRAACTWEGTRAARERYEREKGVTVRDSTLDGIPVAERCGSPGAVRVGDLRGTRIEEVDEEGQEEADDAARQDEEEAVQEWAGPSRHRAPETQPIPVDADAEQRDETDPESEDEEEDDEDDEESGADVVARSVGAALHRRLLAASDAARARGEAAPAIDPAWEQWMKEAAERGVVPYASASATAAAHPAAAPPRALTRAVRSDSAPHVHFLREAPPGATSARERHDARASTPPRAPGGAVPGVFRYGTASALGETLAHVAEVQERLQGPVAAGVGDAGAQGGQT